LGAVFKNFRAIMQSTNEAPERVNFCGNWRHWVSNSHI
jgi:hypothetical protein